MSMTELLSPHLPYLRRYARALTGSQSVGDGYVKQALSALLSGEEKLPEGVAPRIGLYRVFQTIWAGKGGASQRPASEEVSRPDGLLKELSLTTRAALLLTSVEAFSLEEAAFVLDQAPKDVERGILDAQEKIDHLLASRVLIIEDEPIIAMDLENLLTELGHKVVATAATG